MKHKTLYIHAGGGKTGTSGVQIFLSLIASQLKSHDYFYDHSLDTTATSTSSCGNGLPLFHLLKKNNFTEAKLDDLLLRYFGPCSNAICSSEYLSSCTPMHWERLNESSRRLNISVNVIFYVRDLVPFMLSAYDQFIKNHHEHRSFDEWARHSRYARIWRHAEGLRSIAAILPRSSIRVIHYKERSTDSIQSFLDLLGLGDIAPVNRKAFPSRLNRSLTPKERKILIALKSASTGVVGKPLRTKELADLFMHSHPNPEAEQETCNSALASMLAARFENDVNWINDTFFGGSEVVSVSKSSGQQNSRETSATTTATDGSTESIALEWATEELVTAQSRAQHELLNRLDRIVKHYSQQWRPLLPHPQRPSDFDVLAYVLLNRDVLLADIDPVMHFIAHGMSEGRSYSFLEEQPSVVLETSSGTVSHEHQERQP